MMKRNIILEISYWAIIILQSILCFVINRYKNWESLFLINLLVASISFRIHEYFNLKEDDEFYLLKRKKFRIYRFMMTLLITVAIIISYLKTFKYVNFDENKGMKYFCGFISVMIIIIGNLISNIRPNEYLGVNNYFTKKRTDVWRKTNSWTGKFLVFTGLISFLINLITPANQLIFNVIERIYLIIILCALWIICPIIYSWIAYEKDMKKEIVN